MNAIAGSNPTLFTDSSEDTTLKLVTPNRFHRNLNQVRSKPRKPFRSGPVTKKAPFGRGRFINGEFVRYT